MSILIELLNERPKLTALFSGLLFNFAFAPFFIWPFLLSLSVLAYRIKHSKSVKNAFINGWMFGFAFFASNLYWITIGVSVYIKEFWWALPFAFFGLPIILASYIGLVAVGAYYFREKSFFVNSFAAIWVLVEILRTYLLTGFPWSLLGYSAAEFINIIQIASIIGSYGLSAIICFSFSIFIFLLEKQKSKFFVYLVIVVSVWLIISRYGYERLKENETQYSAIKVRLVQPSIKQTDKWTAEKFWDNFNIQKELSFLNIDNFNPHLIIWPESAVTVQPSYVQVHNALKYISTYTKSILITGGITDNLSNQYRSKDKLFASIYAIKDTGELIFDYHKSHLVPFGEYVPFDNIIPISKITPGIMPYSPGKPGFIVEIKELDLKIRPLLCYEIIFPDEVRISNSDPDFILNLSNDAYYGDSSGPYQHFYTTRMRAVENGLPILRGTYNGISAVIDPLGRILIRTEINSRTYIDSHIPIKLSQSTFFTKNGEICLYVYLICSLLTPLIVHKKYIFI